MMRIVLLLLSAVTLSTSLQIRAGQRIAGVNQITSFDASNQPQYSLSASEARELCWSLGQSIASKAQVQEALLQGLETCRFGWIDEHFVVIPRISPSASCGKNKTGLVEWRTSVTQKFDVFCFSEPDTVTQLKDAMADSPLTTRAYPKRAGRPSEAAPSTSKTQRSPPSPPPPSPSLRPVTVSSSEVLPSSQDGAEMEAEASQFMSSAQGSFRVPTKTLLIAVTGALLLLIIAVLGYGSLSRSCFVSWDVRLQEEHMETEEWTCMEYATEPLEDAAEELSIEVDDDQRSVS